MGHLFLDIFRCSSFLIMSPATALRRTFISRHRLLINRVIRPTAISFDERSFCSQVQEEKATEDSLKEQQQSESLKLVYTSNYKRTLHSVKFLSLTGCIGSLIVAPIIIFNPSSIP